MILANARLILPQGIRHNLEVVVSGGKIQEIRKPRVARQAIDLQGSFLAPGFVDLHVHGAVGRDTMDATADSLDAICRYHAGGGTTSLLLATVTASIRKLDSVLGKLRKLWAQFPQVAGVHLEGPFLSRSKAGAHDPEFICQPTPRRVDRLLHYRDLIKRLTIAPEIPGALECIGRFAAAGISVSGGHSNALDDQANAGFERGMRSLTHTFNCMSSARRRENRRVAGLLEFGLSEPQINCELIADGEHVSTTLMKMLYRAKGAAGISLVTDATAGAGLSEGTRFELGGKKCIVCNGVGVLAANAILAGSVSSMINLVRRMALEAKVPLWQAIAMASRNPAREIALAGKGEIAVGNDADLVVISPALEVEKTFLGGQCIYSRGL